jgi:hypothetical protein
MLSPKHIAQLAVLILAVHFYLATANGKAEQRRIVPTVTVRVDTSQVEVKEILQLFENYLNSRPDSLYENSYWSEKDKSSHKDFYSARAWVYPSKDILHAFPPRVLSIEKESEYYVIRTLYYQEGLENPYGGSNPWAVQRLYAGKENREWKLFDPLPIITSDWPRQRIGRLTYIYHLQHRFDQDLAQKQANFVDSVTKAFDLAPIASIEFYITNHQDEMARILGLDYTLGPSSGRSITKNGQVFSALGSEWYPHELIHILFRDHSSCYLLNEGIATLLGGSVGIPFDSLVKDLALYLNNNGTLTFQYMLENPHQAGSTKYFYTTGAVICRAAYEKGGAKRLKELLWTGRPPEDIYKVLHKVLGWEAEKVTEMWRKKVFEYSS